jgi:pimeloyl-ACP methyl ester carboxylesterase
MTILTAGREDAYPLVLLHGWGASKEIWKLVFRPPLTHKFRLIALDFPGTGAVQAARRSSATDLADWVAEETARLGVERFAVLGHSMGGNVAVHLAERHPDRISALVLVAPALQSDRLFHANWYLNKVVGPPALGGARALGGLAGWVERRLPAVEYPGWARGYMRRSGYLMFNNTLPGLRAQLKGLLATPARLERVNPDLPVLIMHGAKDSTIPVAWSKESIERRPMNTRMIVYPQALHCPMDTHTRDFCGDLAVFLDGVR